MAPGDIIQHQLSPRVAVADNGLPEHSDLG
jgi:hypothetical protein